MTLKLLSEWDETLYALLLESFMVKAVPFLWDSCSVVPSIYMASVSACSLCGGLQQPSADEGAAAPPPVVLRFCQRISWTWS